MPNPRRLPAWSRLVREPGAPALIPDGGSACIREPADAVAILHPRARVEEVEVMWVLCLDPGMNVMRASEVARGTIHAVMSAPREIFRLAVATNAHAIIFAHNHPSGDPQPSRMDRETTRAFAQAGMVLGIPLWDSLVLTPEAARFYSFRLAGVLS